MLRFLWGIQTLFPDGLKEKKIVECWYESNKSKKSNNTKHASKPVGFCHWQLLTFDINLLKHFEELARVVIYLKFAPKTYRIFNNRQKFGAEMAFCQFRAGCTNTNRSDFVGFEAVSMVLSDDCEMIVF